MPLVTTDVIFAISPPPLWQWEEGISASAKQTVQKAHGPWGAAFDDIIRLANFAQGTKYETSVIN